MTKQDAQTAPEPDGKSAQIKAVETRSVSCDGGGGVSGHPRVFLEMGDGPHVDCPYCSCRYLYEVEGA